MSSPNRASVSRPLQEDQLYAAAGSTARFADDHSPADLGRGLASPTLSSSSRTPSSCNLDDVESQDDVSSLCESEYEIVNPERRPASSLSARSRSHTAAAHGSAFDDSLLGDHADQWASVSHHETPVSELSVSSHRARERDQHMYDSDLQMTDLDAQEANLLNQSLTSTLAFSRNEQKATESSSETASTCVVNSIGSVVGSSRTEQPASCGVEVVDGTLSAAASQLRFPDPIRCAPLTPFEVLQDCGDGGETRSSSVGDPPQLRNRWTPVPSEAKTVTVSTADRASERGWNRARMPNSDACRSAVASFEQPSQAITETDSKQSDRTMPAPGRPVRRTHVNLPANINVYYLGRRPSPAALWRISHAIKASLGEAAGTALQHHSHKVQDAIIVTRSVAGSGFGNRVLGLKEVDCTVPADASVEQLAAIARYLQGPAARDVRVGNALVICCLENGEAASATSLPHHLASLLGMVHAGLQPFSEPSGYAQDLCRPLVVPVSCRNRASNTDDGSSVTSEGQREFMQQVTKRMDAQTIDKDWTLVLAETLRLLKDSYVAPHLHVQFAPGTTLERVISYETFVCSASSWFRGDITWACRAAMPLSTTYNSPLALLQSEASLSEASPTPWHSKVKRWLSRASTASEESADASMLAVHTTQSRPRPEKRKFEADTIERDDADIERLSTRVSSHYRVLKALILFLSVLSCAALFGRSTLPFTQLVGHATSSHQGSAHSHVAVSVRDIDGWPATSYLYNFTKAVERFENRFVLPSSYRSQPVPDKAGGRRRRQIKSSTSSNVRSSSVANKALAVRNALGQNSGLSIYEKVTSGEAAAPSDLCRSTRGCRSDAAATAQASFHGTEKWIFDMLVKGIRRGSKALLEEFGASWEYWLSELRRVYEEVLLPAKRFYGSKACDTSRRAAELLRAARTASQRFTQRQKREAHDFFSDAVRGAAIVTETAATWADSVADLVKVRTEDTRSWARGTYQDMTKGATIVADEASLRFTSTTDRMRSRGEDLAQRWRARSMQEIRQRRSEARQLRDRLRRSTLRRADEQLEYWFFADEQQSSRA